MKSQKGSHREFFKIGMVSTNIIRVHPVLSVVKFRWQRFFRGYTVFLTFD